jgi:predicted dehydrogenase
MGKLLMTDKLRVGIAGFGIVGKRRRQFIDLHPHLQTVAVCDRTFAETGCFKDGVTYFPHYQQLLAQDLDVLFVCLTNDIAAEVTMAGLEKGLHVFCEKPPGRDLQDMEKVVACKRKHPTLKLKYGFNHRYHDSVSDALTVIQSGQLGNIINLRGVYGKSKMRSINPETDWRTKRAIAGGGILLDQGIHMVDLLRLFAGEFEQVHSFVSNDFWQHDVEDNAYAIMRTADGKVAMLHSTATQWRHRFDLDISLQKGAITLSGILSSTKSYGAEKMTIAWAAEDDMGDPKEQTTRYNQDYSWRNEIEEFAAAMLDNKPIVHGTVEDAYQTMKLVYKIYCADPVWRDRWDLSDQVIPDLSLISERG